MNIGDICSVNSDEGIWYAEIVGVNDTTIEVYFIEQQPQKLWKYSDEWHSIPKESIIKLIKVENGEYKKAYKKLGFNALDGTYFTRIDDPPAKNVLIPIETQDEKYDGPGEYEYDGFVVPDSNEDAFTFADPSIPFVRETHEAVREFENWQPSEEGQKIKNFIDNLDRRVCVEEDNRQFDNGKCLNFIKPPL